MPAYVAVNKPFTVGETASHLLNKHLSTGAKYWRWKDEWNEVSALKYHVASSRGK